MHNVVAADAAVAVAAIPATVVAAAAVVVADILAVAVVADIPTIVPTLPAAAQALPVPAVAALAHIHPAAAVPTILAPATIVPVVPLRLAIVPADRSVLPDLPRLVLTTTAAATIRPVSRDATAVPFHATLEPLVAAHPSTIMLHAQAAYLAKYVLVAVVPKVQPKPKAVAA